jgi:hypothetical protein
MEEINEMECDEMDVIIRDDCDIDDEEPPVLLVQVIVWC